MSDRPSCGRVAHVLQNVGDSDFMIENVPLLRRVFVVAAEIGFPRHKQSDPPAVLGLDDRPRAGCYIWGDRVFSPASGLDLVREVPHNCTRVLQALVAN